ncbi:MAG: ankyrin repeat domain-containing protein [Flavobacteriaceae bacterium]
MKTILFLALSTILSINNINEKTDEVSIQQIIEAIESEDFELVENALKNRIISANETFNGKTLLIYAVISDKAEMINLLVRYGANLNTPADDGLTPMEYAEKLGKVYAKAEIIVITA